MLATGLLPPVGSRRCLVSALVWCGVPLACSSDVGDVLYGSTQSIGEPSMGLIRKLGDVA